MNLLDKRKIANAPWWSSNLTIEREQVQAARRRFQRCTDDEEQRKEAYKILLWKRQEHRFVGPNAIILGRFSKISTRVTHLIRILTDREVDLWITSSSVVGRSGNKIMDCNSTVEELLQYHFPTEIKVTALFMKRLGTRCTNLEKKNRNSPKKNLRLFFSSGKSTSLIDYLSRSYNFFSGPINLYFEDYWISTFEKMSCQNLEKWQI